MSEPTAPDDDHHDHFVCSAVDPSGQRYVVQVVRVFETSGPVFLGGRDPLRPGRVLGLVNRLLARMQPPSTTSDHLQLMVVDVDGHGVVESRDVVDLETGRADALAVADQIRSGAFTAA